MRALLPLGWLVCALLAPLAGAAPAIPETVDRIYELQDARLFWRDQQSPVSLPHALARGQFAPQGERVIYRLNLELSNVPSEPWAIFIVKAARSAQVRINGVDLGGCAPAKLEEMRCAQLPFFLRPATSVWQLGLNRIEIEVYANEMQTNGLSRVLVGPAERLYEERAAPALFWRQGLVMAVNWAIVAFGVMALMIGLAFPGTHRAMYLWFGLACMLRATSHLYATAAIVKDDAFWIQWMFTAGRLASMPVMLLSLLSFFSRRLPWIERFLIAYAVALPVLTAITGARTDIALLLAIPAIVAAIGMLPLLIRWAIADRSPSDGLLAASVLVILGFGLFDAWLLGTVHGFDKPMALPLANGALLATLGGSLIAKMANALVLSDSLNDTLRDRVAVAEANLRRQHETILALERRNARAEEREQLLRDLHDGLGSNLASARMLLEDRSLEPVQMRQLLDDCIDDMRLLLDSSSPHAQLADALGNLRYRIDQRLQGAPLAVEWSLPVEGLPPVPPAVRLQLLRVVQEALANALRHAGARRVTVQASHDTDTGHLRLSVADDGRGFTASNRPGRGLANMQHRTRQIGAALTIDSGDTGTRIEITWPLALAGAHTD